MLSANCVALHGSMQRAQHFSVRKGKLHNLLILLRLQQSNSDYSWRIRCTNTLCVQRILLTPYRIDVCVVFHITLPPKELCKEPFLCTFCASTDCVRQSPLTKSPTRTVPPLTTRARRPPRCSSPSRTPSCVMASRWAHGSHRRMPRKRTSPIVNSRSIR